MLGQETLNQPANHKCILGRTRPRVQSFGFNGKSGDSVTPAPIRDRTHSRGGISAAQPAQLSGAALGPSSERARSAAARCSGRM